MAPPVRRNRLPTLNEVLRRATAPPVDLYCYYIFLQREGAEDTLDFWLDVAQHENLCKAYFKDLRKSGRTVQEDWPAYYDLARNRGSMYNGQINGITRDGKNAWANDEKRQPGASRGGSGDDGGRSLSMSDAGGMVGPSGGVGEKGASHGSLGHVAFDPSDPNNRRTPSPSGQYATGRPSQQAAHHFSPTLARLYPHDRDTPPPTTAGVPSGRRSSLSRRGGRDSTQPYITRDTAITRLDLIASAERIFARYLLSGSEKEIYLPPGLRIHSFPLSSSALPNVESPQSEHETEALARVPDMFIAQKEYVYRMMEQDTFPRFLRAKAFGNLTPVSALVRLGVGLVVLWIALSTAFSLVFLDAKPKSKRLWVILPFFVASLLILSHSYDLDPILVFLKRSETTPFRTIEIREPYVYKLLLGRSVWVVALAAIITAVLSVIFWAVPGHRL